MTDEVFWIGDAAAPELMRIQAELQAAVPLRTFARLAELAPCTVAELAEPALLLLVQRFPGEAAAEEVAAVRRRFPLARWLALLGPWCEGEPRSGKPLPGVARLYWHQWSPRVLGEICKLAAGEPSEWSLPTTAAAEERLLLPAASSPEFAFAAARPLIAVQSDRREHAEALADLLERSGFATYWRRERSSPRETAATIVDLAQGSPQEWRLLAAACRTNRGPVIALLGFPRSEDAARARELGAAALLSKPVDARDLAALISANATPADS